MNGRSVRWISSLPSSFSSLWKIPISDKQIMKCKAKFPSSEGIQLGNPEESPGSQLQLDLALADGAI